MSWQWVIVICTILICVTIITLVSNIYGDKDNETKD
jgi:hypothetical protein